MIFVLVISLYSSRVVLNILGVEDFGIYNVVGSIVLMLSFLNNTLASATQRFFSYEIGRKDNTKLNFYFSASVIIYFLFSVVVVVFLELGGIYLIKYHLVIPVEKMPQAVFAFHISIATFIFFIIRTPFISLMVSYEKMLAYSILNVAEVILKLGFVLLIPFMNIGNILAYSVSLLMATLIITITSILYYYFKFPDVKFSFPKTLEHFNSVSSFAGWSSLSTIATMGIEQGINILINIFFGPVFNTARSISLQIKIQISSFIGNIQLAVSPQITKQIAGGDYENVHNLICFTSKLIFLCALVVCIPFVFYPEKILSLWLGRVPPHAEIFTMLLVVNLLIDSLSGNVPIAIQASGRIKAFQIIQGLVFIIAVPISYFLFSRGFSAYSSVYLTCILSFVCVFIRGYFYSKVMGFYGWLFLSKIFLRNFIAFLFIGFYFLISYIFPNFVGSSLESMFFYFLLFTFYFLFVVFYILFDSSERKLIKSYVKLKFYK